MKIKSSPALFSILLPLILLLPFLTKAYHIDDVFFLWVAQHIHEDPLNFYGFVVNWYGFDQFAHEVNQNPPLVSYFAALGAVFFGWSEPGMHFWFLIPALMLSIGITQLAKQLSVAEMPAMLVAVSTPLYLISATSVMSDVSMSALYVWSVCTWLRGISTDNHRYLLLASILMALAIITKYFAISLIPLLLVYTLWKKRKPEAGLLYLLVPLISLSSYEGISFTLYGHGLVSSAANYSLWEDPNTMSHFRTIVSSLVYMGGCLLSLVFFAGFLFSKKQLGAFIGAVLLIFAGILVDGSVLNPSLGFFPWYVALQYSLCLCLGCVLLALVLGDFVKLRDDASVLILLWVLGTFAFIAFVNWTVSGRNVLVMLPPLALLMAKRFPSRVKILSCSRFVSYSLLFFPAFLLSFSFTMADLTEANGQREIADIIGAKSAGYPGQVIFFGHWGFQYYMEQHGAIPHAYNINFQRGDIVVLPTGNFDFNVKLPEKYLWVIDELEGKSRWLNVMNANSGAGFYSDRRGLLPLNFFGAAPEKYYVFVFGQFSSQEEALLYVRDKGYQLE